MQSIILNMLEKLKRSRVKVSLYAFLVINILVWSFYLSLPDGKLHLKVLDVGQGDAVYLETPGGYRILVDGGPDSRVLKHLGSNVPFYSRKIDLLILTHPQADHLTGLVEVAKRYQIGTLWVSNSENNTKIFAEWQQVLRRKRINKIEVSAGDKITLPDKTNVLVVWPKKDLKSADLNSYSVVVLVSFGNFDALLTGDADRQVQPYTGMSSPVEVFKVPHHGSKTALNEGFVKTLSPEISIISVGERNSYGHPNQGLINFLETIASKVYRTDKNGTVEIVSDGNSWYTNSQR